MKRNGFWSGGGYEVRKSKERAPRELREGMGEGEGQSAKKKETHQSSLPWIPWINPLSVSVK